MINLQDHREELLAAVVDSPLPGQKTARVSIRLPYDRLPTPVYVALEALTPGLRRALSAAESNSKPTTSGGSAHAAQLEQIRRRNALAREGEHMLAVVKRFKDLCQTGVIVSKTTQAECDRIIAAVEGGAS